MIIAAFDPAAALGGGILIGLSAVLLLWLNGRIAGISNLLGGIVHAATAADLPWRLLFLVGLVAGVAVFQGIAGVVPEGRMAFPPWLLAAGGLLVGFGTSLGNGCTSGHGVCGLGRLSLRSFVAVLVFLGTGIATAIVVRHGFGVA
jgi:uncharacterized membrane protein YedE/YeeE